MPPDARPVKKAIGTLSAASHNVLHFLLLFFLLIAPWPGSALDLSKAVVVLPPSPSKLQKQAAVMLVEEIEKRTRVRLATQTAWPNSTAPIISLSTLALQASWPEHYRKE